MRTLKMIEIKFESIGKRKCNYTNRFNFYDNFWNEKNQQWIIIVKKKLVKDEHLHLYIKKDDKKKDFKVREKRKNTINLTDVFTLVGAVVTWLFLLFILLRRKHTSDISILNSIPHLPILCE